MATGQSSGCGRERSAQLCDGNGAQSVLIVCREDGSSQDHQNTKSDRNDVCLLHTFQTERKALRSATNETLLGRQRMIRCARKEHSRRQFAPILYASTTGARGGIESPLRHDRNLLSNNHATFFLSTAPIRYTWRQRERFRSGRGRRCTNLTAVHSNKAISETCCDLAVGLQLDTHTNRGQFGVFKPSLLGAKSMGVTGSFYSLLRRQDAIFARCVQRS